MEQPTGLHFDDANKFEVPRGIVDESGIEQVRKFEIPGGRFAFITHRGGRPEKPNEDCVVLDPEHKAFAVVDAMGGQSNPLLSKQLTSEELLKAFTTNEPLVRAHYSAMRRMESENRNGGACYSAFRINGKMLEAIQGGDTSIVVVNTINRKVKLGATGGENLAMDLRQAIQKSYHGVEPPSTAAIELQNGDRIYAMSDGAWENFSTERLLSKEMLRLPIDTVLKMAYEEALQEMFQKTRGPEWGNPDNFTLFVYEKDSAIT